MHAHARCTLMTWPMHAHALEKIRQFPAATTMYSITITPVLDHLTSHFYIPIITFTNYYWQPRCIPLNYSRSFYHLTSHLTIFMYSFIFYFIKLGNYFFTNTHILSLPLCPDLGYSDLMYYSSWSSNWSCVVSRVLIEWGGKLFSVFMFWNFKGDTLCCFILQSWDCFVLFLLPSLRCILTNALQWPE